METKDILVNEKIVLITLPEHGHLLTCIGFLKRFKIANAQIVVPTGYTEKVSKFIQSVFPEVTFTILELQNATYVSPSKLGTYTLVSHFQSTLSYAHAVKQFLNVMKTKMNETTILIDTVLEYALDKKTIKGLTDIRILQSVIPLTLSLLWRYKIPPTHVLGSIHRVPKNIIKSIIITWKANRNSPVKISTTSILRRHELLRYIVTSNMVIKKVRDAFPRMTFENLWPVIEWQESIPKELRQFIFDNGKVLYISLGAIFNSDISAYKKALENVSALDPVVIACSEKIRPEIVKVVGKKKNIFIKSYLPQLFILKHTKLFITHAGFSGLNQAINLKVPMLMIPIMAEHEVNAKIAQELGYGTILKK